MHRQSAYLIGRDRRVSLVWGFSSHLQLRGPITSDLKCFVGYCREQLKCCDLHFFCMLFVCIRCPLRIYEVCDTKIVGGGQVSVEIIHND